MAEGSLELKNMVTELQDRIKKDCKRIVIIGDALIDHWVHGNLAECQDGCYKFVQTTMCQTPGGADNAMWCLRHWGVTTSLYSFPERYRPIKTRFVNQRTKIVFRHDIDIRSGSDYWAISKEQERALEMVPFAGAVLLSDYDKGFLTPEFIRQVSAKCTEHKIPCIADCKRPPEVYEGCIRKANMDYRNRHPVIPEPCVVTCGAEEPYVNEVRILDGDLVWPNVDCVNHVGAGDCFAVHLALALAYGYSLKEAAALAHNAGRVYVQHEHNRPPYPREIDAHMNTLAHLTLSGREISAT